MSKNKESFIGMGLVFGAAIGIIVGLIFSFNIGLTIPIGAGIGLIFGSVLFSFNSN